MSSLSVKAGRGGPAQGHAGTGSAIAAIAENDAFEGIGDDDL